MSNDFYSFYSFYKPKAKRHFVITFNGSSNSMEAIELKVCLHCKACEKAVRKTLSQIKGVKCVEMNMALNKITVLGYVDRKVVIKAVRKTGRRAEVWPSPCCHRPPQQRNPPAALRCIMPRWFM